MRKVYSTDSVPMAGHVKDLLEQAGIPCFVRNQNLWSGIGQLPPTEVWPEVWITDDRDYGKAREYLEERLSAPEDGRPWRCRCGERIEGQFGACWNCGAERAAE